jgi:short-subunit dehydrogenase
MAERLSPEVVVVTGASAGLGRAIVQEFARHGASIGLLARDPERLEATKVEVEKLGGQAVAIPTDVADPDAVEQAAAATEEAFGPINVWVNNAMTSVFSPVKEMTADEFRRVTEVTYLGYVYGTQAALRRMLPRDRGMIVQVGSALSYRSIPLQSAYCAAKHAIVGFTDSLRSELIHDGSGVGITVVHMPALNTPQFGWVKSRLQRKAQPVPPIFQPEVGAEAVYWAAHHNRRELFVGWPTVKAVWGQKVIPGGIDRFLAHRGYNGQQHNGPEDPDRPHNLWEPVPGRFGAHGSFDDMASAGSMQAWADTHRGWLGAAGLAAAAVALALKARR